MIRVDLLGTKIPMDLPSLDEGGLCWAEISCGTVISTWWSCWTLLRKKSCGPVIRWWGSTLMNKKFLWPCFHLVMSMDLVQVITWWHCTLLSTASPPTDKSIRKQMQRLSPRAHAFTFDYLWRWVWPSVVHQIIDFIVSLREILPSHMMKTLLGSHQPGFPFWSGNSLMNQDMQYFSAKWTSVGGKMKCLIRLLDKHFIWRVPWTTISLIHSILQEHPHRWGKIWIGHIGLKPLETYFGHFGGIFFAPCPEIIPILQG